MKYSFESTGMDKDTFAVVSFKGFESISKPYEFDILLVSEQPDIDPLTVLKNPACFTIHRDEGDNVDFNGILIRFEEIREFKGYLFFRAVLAPKLRWLSLTHHNQIFLDKAAPEIMKEALEDGGLHSGIDFEFSLQGPQPKVAYENKDETGYCVFKYVCQYDESHFDFISRWAEREGIYYFFEQGPSGEKVVFTDSKIRHTDLPLGKDLRYDPPSGLASLHTDEVIHSFVCRHTMMPRKVYLKDYNYLKPSLAVEGIADVDADGRGENYIYGANFDSVEEGNRLAQIRSDALMCRKSLFSGESSVPFMVPGYTFDQNRHYKEAYNRKYLVTAVTHEGHQNGYLISGLGDALSSRETEMFYANSFTAIYADAQFRPEHLTEKPKITGTITAKIDASTSGKYAEVDDLGRYKVILPFDRSGRFGGKASAWFRMMQPYAGDNQGMHFPLHKGTEVLLTFMDGNPDRPLIAGAVPNPETSSPVTSQNQTQSVLSTGKNKPDHSAGAKTYSRSEKDTTADNYIEFDDDDGNEYLKLYSTNRIEAYAAGSGSRPSYKRTILGPSEKGSHWDINESENSIADLKQTLKDFNPTEFQRYDSSYPDPSNLSWSQVVENGHIQVARHDTFNIQEGNIYDFGGYWNYNLGNGYVENHTNQQAELNKQHECEYPKAKYTMWNTIVAAVGGIIGTVISSSVLLGKKLIKKPLKLGIFGVGSVVVQFIVGIILQPVLWPGTTGRGSGIKDLLEGGAEKFNDMASKQEYIQGKHVKLRADKTWVTKSIVEGGKEGGEYNYTKADGIDINIGNKEEHNKGNSYTFTYGGRHEEYKYRGNGLLKEWSGAGLKTPTFGIVNSAAAKFDTTGALAHFEASLVGQKIDIAFPTIPKLTFKLDGSFGNLTMHAATGGNIDIDLGGGDDIKLVVTDKVLELKSKVDDEKLKAKIKDVATEALDADIKLVNKKLSELRLDTLNMGMSLIDKQLELKQEFNGQIQELKTAAVQLKKISSIRLDKANIDITKLEMKLNQQSLRMDA